jgi:hypothetical protein
LKHGAPAVLCLITVIISFIIISVIIVLLLLYCHYIIISLLHRLATGHKKQQHKADQVGWFVACFFKSHAAQLRHWVWSADHFPHQATSSTSLQSQPQ